MYLLDKDIFKHTAQLNFAPAFKKVNSYLLVPMTAKQTLYFGEKVLTNKRNADYGDYSCARTDDYANF